MNKIYYKDIPYKVGGDSTLVEATITERGETSASDFRADGFSKVNVDVPYTDVHYAKDDIVSFEGEDFPLKSLTAYITALQDLHGYDYPWVGGSGKNLFNMGSKWSGSASGLSFTTDDDYVTMNGVKSGANYVTPSQLYFDLPAGTYYAKAFVISGTASNEPSIYVYSNQELTSNMLNTGRSFTLESQTSVGIRFAFWNDGATYSNYKIGIVISKDADIDKFYPYSNICPISGWTACNVVRTGKNLFGGLPMAENIVEVGRNATLDTTNKTVTFTSSVPKDDSYERSISEGFKFKENTVYTFVATYSNSGNNSSLRFRNTTGTNQEILLANTNGQKTKIAVTASSDFSLKDIILSFYSASSTTLYYEESGLFEGTITAQDFEPYNGNTYTIDLDGTRYGGKLDVVNGVLTVDRVKLTNDYLINTASYEIAGRGCFALIGITLKSMSSGVVDTKLMASALKTSSQNDLYTNRNIGIAHWWNTRIGFSTGDETITTVSAFKQWLADNGSDVCYELATPQTIQLSKQQIRSLVGVNNIFADTGEVAVEWQTLYHTP